MDKIPIKIVELKSPSGQTAIDVMIDVYDYTEIENGQQKIKKFKKKYVDLIKLSQKTMPKEKSKRKPSHHWQIGKLLYDFNKSIKNTFEIINYQDAIQRDFNLIDKRRIGLILQFGKEFTKKDVSDSISYSHYVELIWHANMLIKLKLFEQEKKRLLDMAKNKNLPNSHVYSKQLDKLTKPLQTRKIQTE